MVYILSWINEKGKNKKADLEAELQELKLQYKILDEKVRIQAKAQNCMANDLRPMYKEWKDKQAEKEQKDVGRAYE